MGSSQSTEHPVQAAIDFGTTFTGYAFMFNGENEVYTMEPKDREMTCVLLNHDGTFRAFGNEAFYAYNDMDLESQFNHFFFQQFKMTLYGDRLLRRNIPQLTDVSGKKMDAMQIFGLVLNEFKKRIVKHVNGSKVQKGATFDESNIGWTVTVPTIWSASARQFMLESAANAGMNLQNIRLVLEPEAASVYVTSLDIKYERKGFKVEPFSPGQKYILADLGGGTVDMCVHEVLRGNYLSELYSATGRNAGGSMVNKAFAELLERLFGTYVIEKYKEIFPTLYGDLMMNFEVRKCEFKTDSLGATFNLSSELISVYKDEYKYTDSELTTKLKEQSGSDITFIRQGGYRLKLTNSAMKSLFEHSVKGILELLSEIQKECAQDNIRILLLAGAYSESDYVREQIKAAFPRFEIVTIPDSRLAVVKGAVLLGFKPRNTIKRRSRFTLGFYSVVPFNEELHPQELKEYHENLPQCRAVFHKLITKGQAIEYGQVFQRKSITQYQQQDTKNKTRITSLWRSTHADPKFCTSDHGCEEVGSIEMNPPQGGWPDNLVHEQQLVVGETELVLKFCNKTNEIDVEKRLEYSF
ncbi:heat shock 70 kDa protein 12A-like [Mya arenaria]|uniref:heat shock 70 kDa protein 12A-like n=1 Tax=Mya arenaria TaxID=6604 RepID=UPI0022E11A60|nr:heat shock 70 kDa protein 12A-like [Mya arenaria]